MLQAAKSALQTPFKAAFIHFYVRSNLFLSKLEGFATATAPCRPTHSAQEQPRFQLIKAPAFYFLSHPHGNVLPEAPLSVGVVLNKRVLAS
jgi:hypothetical protein